MGNDGATEELAPVETHQLRGICPHCGRLRKKSALPLEFAAGFGLAVVLGAGDPAHPARLNAQRMTVAVPALVYM